MASNKTESIDTNIVLRLLLQDNQEHFEKALKLMERLNVTYIVSDFVMLEVVFVLTNIGIERQDIVGALTKIMARPNVKTNRHIFTEVFFMYLDHPKLSFADCYLAVEAAQNEAEPLWTFDQKLASQAKNARLVGE